MKKKVILFYLVLSTIPIHHVQSQQGGWWSRLKEYWYQSPRESTVSTQSPSETNEPYEEKEHDVIEQDYHKPQLVKESIEIPKYRESATQQQPLKTENSPITIWNLDTIALESWLEQVWAKVNAIFTGKFDRTYLMELSMQDNQADNIWNYDKENQQYIFNDAMQATINDTIQKTFKAYDNDASKAIGSTNAAIKDELYNIVRRALLFITQEEQSFRSKFEWCSCIKVPQRLTLFLKLLHDIEKQYSNKEEQLVYTSFASGGLLQDAVLLTELLHRGYINVAVNLISLEYPDPVELNLLIRKFSSAYKYGLTEHASYLMKLDEVRQFHDETEEEQTKDILESEWIIQQFRNTFKDKLNITIYDNMNDYYNRAARSSQEKSNVLVLVDPAVAIFQIPSYPSQANMASITLDGVQTNGEPQFYIIMPNNRPAELYMQMPDKEVVTDDQEYKRQEELLQKTKEKIVTLIHNTADTMHNFTLLKQELVNSFHRYDITLLKQFFISQIYLLKQTENNNIDITKVKENMLAALYAMKKNSSISISVDDEIKNLTHLDLSESENSIAQIILDTILSPLLKKLNNIPSLFTELKWYSDPHIAFQKLIEKAPVTDCIIYQLYHADPIAYLSDYTDNAKASLRKLDTSSYLKEDVVKPNIGDYLTKRASIPMPPVNLQGYEHIKPERDFVKVPL